MPYSVYGDRARPSGQRRPPEDHFTRETVDEVKALCDGLKRSGLYDRIQIWHGEPGFVSRFLQQWKAGEEVKWKVEDSQHLIPRKV